MGWRVSVVLIALAPLLACSTPPNREIDQAQGAIDAARAAGAEQYAAEELGAAVQALDQARAAVEARDYHTALSEAIDSRDQAQEAARQAAEARAAMQSQAERLVTEMRLLLERGKERVAVAEARGLPRASITRVRSSLASGINALQEASAAMAQGDYAAVQSRLEGVHKETAEAVAQLDALLSGP